MNRILLSLSLSAVLFTSACGASTGFRSDWPSEGTHVWAGPHFWANPLQDWRVRDGWLECIAAGGDRNVFLLTRETAERTGTLRTRVRITRLGEDASALKEGFVGFRVGVRGYFKDYRDSAVRGIGLNAGVLADGRLFIGRVGDSAPRIEDLSSEFELELSASPSGSVYTATLTARNTSGRRLAETSRNDILPAWLAGGIALVCSSGPVEPTPAAETTLIDPGTGGKRGTQRGGTLRFRFQDWRVEGTKLDVHEERAFGPILFAMYTVDRNVLKLTAQFAPVDNLSEQPRLEVQEMQGGTWQVVTRAPIHPMSRTVTFRVADWDSSRDARYRVVWGERHAWEGMIRKDPAAKPQIVVAAFTGNNDFGFPHADVVRNVRHFNPDLLVFTGDNIYERVGEYGIQREPIETATLDYLRKWYLFGWEYRELLSDIPAVCLVDDHDVYHGNIWGAGGRHAEGTGYTGQDKGGYTMPAEWVNMVQRTQTSHMPDPPDPRPVEQGITVYFTELRLGGVSFAAIEDRKWKSAPRELLPRADIVNGWAQNPAYDAARDGDVPGAQLLGTRQEEFLEKWASDWSGGAWMKVVLSQTLFANVATLPKGSHSDEVTPKLPVLAPGEYPSDDWPVADHDSDGWPQTARLRALRSMRRALAIHIAGDQHLGSTIQYGIDSWNDGPWAICVPSVANVWPRRWFPSEPGRNRKAGAPRYTGEFLDGFGNKVTVHAASNPSSVPVEPTPLFSRAPGYGIVSFERSTRKITLANWPRWVDATQPGASPYPGWPITIDQSDNGLPDSGWFLETVTAKDMQDPVIQVIDQAAGSIVYTFRIQGSSIRPPVRKSGLYTVRFLDPDRGLTQEFKDVSAQRQ